MAVKTKRKAKPLLFIIIALAFILFIAAGLWMFLASPVNKNSKDKIEVIIPAGTTSRQIGTILKEKGLIRNELFYNVYIKLTGVGPMKASRYTLYKNMSLEEIVNRIEKGNSYNPDAVRITFYEGDRITDYCDKIASKTNHTYEEVIAVMKDREYIKGLIPNYWFLSEKILDENIYYPLEGYLAPNTYEFTNKDVPVDTIIEVLLKQTEKDLKKYKDKIADPHYTITMASILEVEGTALDNKKEIAGVFENRLAAKWSLGSDATTYYALQLPITTDLTTAQFNVANPYNTRSTITTGKMPVGPICNPSLESIEASVNPTKTENFFFVADKYGKIYFTKTLSQHNAKVQEIKEKGDWIW